MKIRENHLESGCFYHIFNRGVNSKMVFLSDENFSFFLRKVKLYLIPYFDIYAYCLMPNHFHLLLNWNLKLMVFLLLKTVGFIRKVAFSANRSEDWSAAIPRLLIKSISEAGLFLNRLSKEFVSILKNIWEI